MLRRWRGCKAALLCMTCAWSIAAHADADPNLAALKSRIESGAIPGIHSVLAIVGGKTVAEWYFSGADQAMGDRGPVALPHAAFGPATLHDVRSVTKSVVSILFGIAKDDGAIGSLDTPVLDFFPEYVDLRTPERLKIRLRDVLSMTSGWHWDEHTHPYTDKRNSEIAMDIAADPLRYVLTQAIDAPPGELFNYSGGDVALVGAIVARATKTPLEAFAVQRLFGPLDIDQFEWAKNGDVPRAASGLRLTTPDMAKIGSLMLAGGDWRGKRVVSREWVELSTSPHATVEPNARCGTQYGYLWWLVADCATEPPTRAFAAIGNGGQRIWVVPSRAAVVASTAGLYDAARQGESPLAVLTGILGGSAAP